MSSEAARALVDFLRDTTDGHLRSVAEYDAFGSELVYIRGDVAARYDETIDTVLEDTRLEAISRTYHERLFGDQHGDLHCMVKYFENVVEFNFALSESRGLAVALDPAAMEAQKTVLSQCRSVVRSAEST